MMMRRANAKQEADTDIAKQRIKEEAEELKLRCFEVLQQQQEAATERERINEQRKQVTVLTSLVTAPAYWSITNLDTVQKSRKIDVTAEMKDSIIWLLNDTAKPQFHGIGRDSHNTKFKTFGVKKVWRVENSAAWKACGALVFSPLFILRM